MGWNIDIIADRKVSESDVEQIVANLPEKYRSHIPNMVALKNGSGWSAYCDIRFPKGNVLPLSGAYGISGEYAEEMAEYIKEEMKKIGYSVQLECHW